jgi:hypothetical protein
LKVGGAATSLAYDGEIFFSDAHPVNPFNTGAGTFSNNFTAGSGAGAVPIDESVSLDVAATNLTAALAYIAGLTMPNGVDPRRLRARAILHPSAMTVRVAQLLGASIIPVDSTSGAGSADHEPVRRAWGFNPPIEGDELGAAAGGSDTDYYLIAEQVSGDELGGLVYVNREPFAMTFYTGQDGAATGLDALLSRTRMFEWHTQGRNVVGYGHPYLIFRCRAT